MRSRAFPRRLRLADALLTEQGFSSVEALNAWRRRPSRIATCAVDVGLGVDASSTVEFAAQLRRLEPSARVIGVDLNPAWVARATAAFPDVEFRVADAATDLITCCPDGIQLIRAMNVLRSYRTRDRRRFERAFLTACDLGALVIEGSTDRDGSRSAAGLWRCSADGLLPIGLALGVDLTTDFGPMMFRACLPSDLRSQATADTEVGRFLLTWAGHADDARRTTREPSVVFERSVHRLGDDYDLRWWTGDSQEGIVYWQGAGYREP